MYILPLLKSWFFNLLYNFSHNDSGTDCNWCLWKFTKLLISLLTAIVFFFKLLIIIYIFNLYFDILNNYLFLLVYIINIKDYNIYKYFNIIIKIFFFIQIINNNFKFIR